MENKDQSLFANSLEKYYPGLGTFYIHHPTLDEDSKVEDFYYKKYNEIIENNTLPSISKVLENLEKSGQWTKDDELSIDNKITEISNLSIDTAQFKKQLSGSKNKINKKNQDKLDELLSKMTKLETDLAILTTKKSHFLESTAEKRAERYAILYKLILCVKDKDGNRVWNSLDELGKKKAGDIKPLVIDALSFWKGVDNPLSENLLGLIDGN